MGSNWYTLETTADNEVSKWAYLPAGTSSPFVVCVTIQTTGAASGTIYTTHDSPGTVKEGTPIAVAWPFGAVSGSLQGMCGQCTALRVVQTGVGTVSVRIQVVF